MLSACFKKKKRKFHFTGMEIHGPLINGSVPSWATFLFSTFPEEKLISRWWLVIKSIMVFGFNHIVHLSDLAELNLHVKLHYCVGTASVLSYEHKTFMDNFKHHFISLIEVDVFVAYLSSYAGTLGPMRIE